MSSKVNNVSAKKPVAKTEKPKKAAAEKTSKSKKSESIFWQSSQKEAAKTNKSGTINSSFSEEVAIARKTVSTSKKQLGLTQCDTNVGITKDNLAEKAQSNLYLLIRCFEGDPSNSYGLYLDNKKAKEPGQLSGGYRKVCNKLLECNNALNNATKNKFSKLPNSIREALLDLVYVRNEGATFIRNNQELMDAIMNDDYSTIISNLVYINQKDEGTVRGYYRRSFNRAALACRDLQGKELKEAILETENIYKKALDSFNKNGSDSKLLRDEHTNFELTYAETLAEIDKENKAKEAARKDSIEKAELAKLEAVNGVNTDSIANNSNETSKSDDEFLTKLKSGIKKIMNISLIPLAFTVGTINKIANGVKNIFSKKEYEFDENLSVIENMLNDGTVQIEENENSELKTITVDYEVQDGDYLCVLAEKYGMQDDIIANNNDITNKDCIQKGQVVKMQKLAYKVKEGEMLENIAQKFGVSSIALREVNNMDAKDNVSKDQIIEIPGFIYKIKDGDTLGKIAEMSGISLDKLKEINRFKDDHKIKSGDIIKVTYKDGDFSVPESDLKIFSKSKKIIDKISKKDKSGNEIKFFDNAADLIKNYEGLYLKAYVCPAGKLTIGWGHTSGVRKGDVISEKQAEKYLSQDMRKAEQAVSKHVKVKLTKSQHDALVSFVFNLGEGKFKKSTLLKLVNKGEFEKASHQFERWIYAKGKPCDGLIKRRASEKELFLMDQNKTILADSRVAF